MTADLGYQRLLQLGKHQGGLTVHDIEQALQVERLSVDEIAELVARLEDAGVPVDVDPALLSPAAPAHRRLDEGPPDGVMNTDPPLQSRVAIGVPAVAHAQPQSRAATPKVTRTAVSYIRDQTVWKAVTVVIGAILLLAAFLTIA